MKLRWPRFNWFDCLLIAIGLIVLSAMMGFWYIYGGPSVHKFSCQIDRTKPAEGCHFILIGNNFRAPIQAYIMFPAMVEQSLLHVQLKKAELGATPFVSFWQGKKLVGFYRVEDVNALMALIARSGFAILTADKLHLQKDFSFKKEVIFKFSCKAQLGEALSCEEAK